VQLDYRSPSTSPTRRATRPIVVVPAIIVFGSATAVFVFMAVRWSNQLAIDSRFSSHTDGLRLSVYLAWIAAVLLFLGTCAAAPELVRGRRDAAERTPK
jgi:hypothetical protein